MTLWSILFPVLEYKLVKPFGLLTHSCCCPSARPAEQPISSLHLVCFTFFLAAKILVDGHSMPCTCPAQRRTDLLIHAQGSSRSLGQGEADGRLAEISQVLIGLQAQMAEVAAASRSRPASPGPYPTPPPLPRSQPEASMDPNSRIPRGPLPAAPRPASAWVAGGSVPKRPREALAQNPVEPPARGLKGPAARSHREPPPEAVLQEASEEPEPAMHYHRQKPSEAPRAPPEPPGGAEPVESHQPGADRSQHPPPQPPSRASWAPPEDDQGLGHDDRSGADEDLDRHGGWPQDGALRKVADLDLQDSHGRRSAGWLGEDFSYLPEGLPQGQGCVPPGGQISGGPAWAGLFYRLTTRAANAAYSAVVAYDQRHISDC